MNFYSLDGKDYNIDTFENVNGQMNINLPLSNSKLSDSDYQCSDSYKLTGDLIKSFESESPSMCKVACGNSTDCVGFDYDSVNKMCNLKKNITELNTQDPNSMFCVKKNMEQICDSGVNKSTPNKMVSSSVSDMNGSSSSSGSSNGSSSSSNGSSSTSSSSNSSSSSSSSSADLDSSNCIKCDQSNKIYVDLNTYLSRMSKLKDHSDNIFVELPLVLSNIRSCSYMAKNPLDTLVSSKSDNNINQALDSLTPPTPSVVKLDENINVSGSGVVSGSDTLSIQVIEENGQKKEGFALLDRLSWSNKELMLIVVIILLIYFMVYKKKV